MYFYFKEDKICLSHCIIVCRSSSHCAPYGCHPKKLVLENVHTRYKHCTGYRSKVARRVNFADIRTDKLTDGRTWTLCHRSPDRWTWNSWTHAHTHARKDRRICYICVIYVIYIIKYNVVLLRTFTGHPVFADDLQELCPTHTPTISVGTGRRQGNTHAAVFWT